MRAGQALVWAVLAMWPATGQALDCAAPSFARDFWSYKASPETYEAVYGTFSNLRNPRHDIAGDVVTWEATFTGFRASGRAFDKPLLTDVTINYMLFSDIAGGARDPGLSGSWLDGVEGVVFLQQSGEGYVATTGLCSPLIYTEPGAVATALDCLNGRRCPRE
jgi:hypothetical protein